MPRKYLIVRIFNNFKFLMWEYFFQLTNYIVSRSEFKYVMKMITVQSLYIQNQAKSSTRPSILEELQLKGEMLGLMF